MLIGRLKLDGNFFLAPMAGYTNWPMRLICRKMGAALVFTEMVSANSLVWGQGRSRSRTRDLLESRAGEKPLGVQIFGAVPETMARAASMVEEMGADLVDINMGCPVKKVVRSGAGAALLKDPARAGRVIRLVRKAIDVPLTVKIRTGWDQGSINCDLIARIAREEGADAVTVHARHARQPYGQPADRSLIARTVEAVNIPVIGNGDIKSGGNAKRMLVETGCAAVMIGRAARGNPWIFREARAGESKAASLPPAEKREIITLHYRFLIEHVGERLATLQMRKHLAKYSRGLPEAAEFRVLVNRAERPDQVLQIIDRFFSC